MPGNGRVCSMNVTNSSPSSLESAKPAGNGIPPNPKSEIRNPKCPHDSLPRIPSFRLGRGRGECDWRRHRHFLQMGAEVLEVLHRVGFRVHAGDGVSGDDTGELVAHVVGAGSGTGGLPDRAYVRTHIRIASALR